MFFATLIAAPVLAGLVAGVWTARRAVPWGLAAVCVALGIAGAIAMGIQGPDYRLENVSFGIGAGIVCAGLVWLGYAFGRISQRTSRGLLGSCLILITAAALAGCGGSDEAEPNLVVIRGGEYAFVMPDQIKGGVVTLEFSNTGRELHEYSLGRITDESKTAADVQKLFTAGGAEEKGEEVGWIEDVGGVPALSPGETIAITRTLEPGRYVFVCPLPAPDGRLHSDHGMVKMFEVEGRSEAELPDAEAVVTATGNGFKVPKLEAGRNTIELRNGASDERGFILFSPRPGKTLEDIGTWAESGFKGRAPATLLGATQSIPPRKSVFLTLELKAARRYVFFDEENQTPFAVSR